MNHEIVTQIWSCYSFDFSYLDSPFYNTLEKIFQNKSLFVPTYIYYTIIRYYEFSFLTRSFFVYFYCFTTPVKLLPIIHYFHIVFVANEIKLVLYLEFYIH